MPWSLFGPVYDYLVVPENGPLHVLDAVFGFTEQDKLRHFGGRYEFEAICCSLVLAITISLAALLMNRNYQRVPTGVRNLVEAVVEALRAVFRSLIGDKADEHLPFLGSLFLTIACMNLMGLIPGFKPPTMVLPITFALGLTTFVYVQAQAIRANGAVGYLKHMMGSVLPLVNETAHAARPAVKTLVVPAAMLALLMLVLELVGECIKPLSLSLRLYGNISGEKTLATTFLAMGLPAFPLYVFFLGFSVGLGLLQAFIFTALTCIYLDLVTTHHDEGGHGSERGHTDASGHGSAGHPVPASR